MSMDDVPTEISDSDDDMSAIAVKKRSHEVNKFYKNMSEPLILITFKESDSDDEPNQKKKYKPSETIETTDSSQSD